MWWYIPTQEFMETIETIISSENYICFVLCEFSNPPLTFHFSPSLSIPSLCVSWRRLYLYWQQESCLEPALDIFISYWRNVLRVHLIFLGIFPPVRKTKRIWPLQQYPMEDRVTRFQLTTKKTEKLRVTGYLPTPLSHKTVTYCTQ